MIFWEGAIQDDSMHSFDFNQREIASFTGTNTQWAMPQLQGLMGTEATPPSHRDWRALKPRLLHTRTDGHRSHASFTGSDRHQVHVFFTGILNFGFKSLTHIWDQNILMVHIKGFRLKTYLIWAIKSNQIKSETILCQNCFLSHLYGHERPFPALLKHAMCAPCDYWINELCSVVLPTQWQSDKDISCGPPATNPTSPSITVLYVVFCRQLRIHRSSGRRSPRAEC